MASVGDYGFLSDCQSGALVSRDGSVDWLCFPRFDSPAIFCRLLDPDAGHWSMQPAGHFVARRRYERDTLVLVTEFATDQGRVELVDALAFRTGVRGHEIGLDSPHVLLRELRVLEGEVTMVSVLRPRMEYGLTLPRMEQLDATTIRARAGATTLVCHATVPLDTVDGGIQARFQLRAGERATFRLAYRPTFPDVALAVADGSAELADTIVAWRSWADVHWGAQRTGYDGLYLEQVRRSALVLQGLTYQPSGAVVAAATTSLPERPGGSWNWDYRFSWLRDASFMLQALWIAACPDEPQAFFNWIDLASGGDEASKVQIVYGVQGERDLSERELPHLRGFGGSRPVRVGNAAWLQKQLDVLGEVLDAALLLDGNVTDWSPAAKRLLISFADRAAESWREPDAGMWEVRDKERHYTSSKVMAWVALDRAIRLAGRLGVHGGRLDWWRRERQAARDVILSGAWSSAREAFTGSFGSGKLDASVLLMPLVGFIDPDDPRMQSTVHAIRRELSVRGLVRRWAGEPNGFMLAGYWMVRCLALMGELDRAREQFETLSGYGNDLGLLPEEGDPKTGAGLGNVPQAFSHVGLINAAWELTLAERGEDERKRWSAYERYTER